MGERKGRERKRSKISFSDLRRSASRNSSSKELKFYLLDEGYMCEIPRKSNFLKKGKMVILVKIRNFSRSWMTKRISSLESSREI